MATLNWIGKEKVINHHLDVPFRTLRHKYTFKNGETLTDGIRSENKIIHGDNLEALKSLLPEYEGKIKCIYIDPPYNTGNEGWVYNDNVNHPKIKKWLGEVVGKEGDDLSRHDKWLCMMYPRLKLLHKLLADDGVIFVSIDDNEHANLKLICDEIFGSYNSIGPIIQNKMNAKNDTVNIQKNHEFVVVYRKKIKLKNGTNIQPTLINVEYKDRAVFEENGRYYYITDPITTRGEGGILNARPNLGYTVYYNPKTKDKIAVCDYNINLAKTSNNISELYSTDKELVKLGYEIIRPPQVRGKLGCWTWSLEKFNIEKDSIIITGQNHTYSVKKRTFVDIDKIIEVNGKIFFRSRIKRNSRSILDFSTNEGTKVLSDTMGESSVFDNPKNIKLIEYLINLISDNEATVLDSFAGSGTTAHAVLNLNKQDGGNRKFILVEMEDYAENITAERVKRVISGYGENKKVEGTGGDFEYLELGNPLFDEDGYLNESQPDEDIRKYVYFSETRSNVGYSENPRNESYLGKKSKTAYYFYYKKEKVTTLDLDFISTIEIKADLYIVYADKCALSEKFLQENKIIFKKIPRDINRI